MTPIIALAFVLAQLAGAPTEAAPDPAALKDMAQRVLKRVEEMRGQKLDKPLAMGVKSRDEVTTFIQQRLKDEYGPEKVAAEGRLLALHGLLPADLDYGGYITRLLTEQVAGFYDHTRQELHIAAWLPVFLQEPVMAHEIFHAIQDQMWGGGKLIDSKKYTHDEVLAHAALLEGDATIVMLNYQQGAFGAEGDVTGSPFTIKMVAASLPMQMSSPQFPIMAAAPDYLKQSLIFPYQQGLLFVAALREAGLSWDDIRKVYADPPNTTEQILHPEKYHGERDHPSKVELGPLGLDGFSRTWDGTLGEFHARQQLLAGLPQAEAEKGAAGWDGDYAALEVSKARAVAVTLSTWDSEDEAREFEAALRKVHEKRKAPRPHLALERRGADLAYAYSEDEALAAQALKLAWEKGKITRR